MPALPIKPIVQINLEMKQSITNLILLLLLLPALAFGQTRRSYEKTAAKYLQKNDYFGAMRNYQRAVALDSTNLSNIVGAADAARKFTAFAIAEEYYEMAIKVDTNYQTQSLFWLGYSENSQGKYAEAEEHYKEWMKYRTPSDSLYTMAELYLTHNK